MEYNKKNTARRPMECTEEHYTSEYNRIFGIKSKVEVKEVEVDPTYYEGFGEIEE